METPASPRVVAQRPDSGPRPKGVARARSLGRGFARTPYTGGVPIEVPVAKAYLGVPNTLGHGWTCGTARVDCACLNRHAARDGTEAATGCGLEPDHWLQGQTYQGRRTTTPRPGDPASANPPRPAAPDLPRRVTSPARKDHHMLLPLPVLRRRRTSSRLALGAAALLTAALTLTTPAHASAPAAGEQPTLTGAVSTRLHTEAPETAGIAGTDTRIDVTRTQGRWAFGTAVLATPAGSEQLPEGRLFLAHRDTAGWTVTFDGESAFTRLARISPVMHTPEQRLLSTATDGPQTAVAGDLRTGMALPYSTGQSWTMAGGPHGWAGEAAPWSSLDLAGGDQVVRAVRAGTAYTMCQGWIRVLHDRGYATDYYHLWNNIGVDGAAVQAGAFLGNTGTDVTCGGSALGRHVHLGLRHNDAYIGIAGHNLGKWVLQNGGSAYQGSALHGSQQVAAGGALYNHGALGFTQGVVDTYGGTTLTRRTGPGTGYAVAGSVADGATVTISCSRTGTSHTGRWGTSSWWDRLSDGTWISDAYVWTGVDGPINGTC